jgi:hypothetical protein
MQMEDLSPARQKLLRLFQTINFGRVEELEIRNGEPAFSPAPRVLVELKLDVEDGPRPESGLNRFPLRKQVARFFDRIGGLNHGTVELIEIRHGMPFRMVIEAVPGEVEP